MVKLIHSLELKKNRKREGLFVAEGPKVVGDLMRIEKPLTVIATHEWMEGNGNYNGEITVVSEDELRKVSLLQHPQQVMALFPIPQDEEDADVAYDSLCLAIDGVQDPGNLGTIIRIADWFGINTILCSRDTADAYNPKVVQATMGSIARVRVVYTDLEAVIRERRDIMPVYGTLLDGDDIYKKELTDNGIIVLGNEGNGISPVVRELLTERLLIPCYNTGDRAESLNVATATAIVCSEFRRRK